MRAFLIGVAGSGMAPLAGLLRRAGYEVWGSDVAFDPPMGPRLEQWGVRTFRGTDAACLDGLDPAVDVVVVGNVCRKDHPLVLAAEARGLRRISMPTAIRELIAKTPAGQRPVVAIAGTHGKTTTTAMVAWLLARGGLEPGWLVGGVPVKPLAGGEGEGEPFEVGRATRSLTAKAPLAPFVIEGDEYDSAFFEKVPKVWGYAPKLAILTSIEHDHVDIYPDAEAYRDAFRGLLARLPSEADGGLLVANAGDPEVVALIAREKPACRVVWYAASDVAGRGFPQGATLPEPVVWTAAEVGLTGDGDATQPFDLFVGPSSAGRFGVGVFGVHNVTNAVAALALAVEGFGLPVRETAGALASFIGVKRRQEKLVDGAHAARGVTLYDDFAHHPTAVDATLRSIRARHRRARLLALYEPRSATACRAMHQAAYPGSFDAADEIVLAPLGRSTIPEAERLDLARLAADLRARGKAVECPGDLDALVAHVLGRAQAGDVILSMSNGAFGGVNRRLIEGLR
jgi:UDP-N-acetylmuramate: L-alanyl-gamma-D-glutamyl-meso-diaminopimelate ligase